MTLEEVGSDGHKFELYFWGITNLDFQMPPRVDIKEAIRLVKSSQGDTWDPKHPSTLPAQELLALIKAEIKKITLEDDPDISIYRATHIPEFDVTHKGDGFITYREHAMVVVDTTTMSWKENEKAVIIRKLDLEQGRLPTIAYQIAKTLIRQEEEGEITDAMWHNDSDNTLNDA